MSDELTTPTRSRRGALILAGFAGLGILAAGAVSADWSRSWRPGPREGRIERDARFARFCRNDTARYQPVVRVFVRADLRLDQAQAERFDKLADLVLPGLEEVKREVCNDFVTRGGPAPERMAHLARSLRQAADLAEKAVEPSREFYASLNDEQKGRVDELTSRRPGFGGPPR